MKRLTMSQAEIMTGLHFTRKHKGKMIGMSSISTSPLLNKYCMERSKNPNLICSKCYAMALLEYRSDNKPCLQRNTEILTARVLDDGEIPFLTSETGAFRFEAFGDLNNAIQAINYLKMAVLNPQTKFAWWTKNPWFIDSAFKLSGLEKPANLIIIGSSPIVNESAAKYYSKYAFIDYCFTVYTKQYAMDNHIEINCGGRLCADCMCCYDGTHSSFEINELLK